MSLDRQRLYFRLILTRNSFIVLFEDSIIYRKKHQGHLAFFVSAWAGIYSLERVGEPLNLVWISG